MVEVVNSGKNVDYAQISKWQNGYKCEKVKGTMAKNVFTYDPDCSSIAL